LFNRKYSVSALKKTFSFYLKIKNYKEKHFYGLTIRRNEYFLYIFRVSWKIIIIFIRNNKNIYLKKKKKKNVLWRFFFIINHVKIYGIISSNFYFFVELAEFLILGKEWMTREKGMISIYFFIFAFLLFQLRSSFYLVYLGL